MANYDDIIQLLLAVGAGGIIGEALRSFVQRKKMGADYADVISTSAIRLLKPLEDRIKELEDELAQTKRDLTSARSELTAARREIRHLTTMLKHTEVIVDEEYKPEE